MAPWINRTATSGEALTGKTRMAEHFKGPWKVGYRAMDVLAPSAKGGDTKVCDIRAWGYLTGKGAGALGLTDDEAVAIQTANARLIAAAPDMLEALQRVASVIDDAGRVNERGLTHKLVLAVIAKALPDPTPPSSIPEGGEERSR